MKNSKQALLVVFILSVLSSCGPKESPVRYPINQRNILRVNLVHNDDTCKVSKYTRFIVMNRLKQVKDSFTMEGPHDAELQVIGRNGDTTFLQIKDSLYTWKGGQGLYYRTSLSLLDVKNLYAECK